MSLIHSNPNSLKGLKRKPSQQIGFYPNLKKKLIANEHILSKHVVHEKFIDISRKVAKEVLSEKPMGEVK